MIRVDIINIFLCNRTPSRMLIDPSEGKICLVIVKLIYYNPHFIINIFYCCNLLLESFPVKILQVMTSFKQIIVLNHRNAINVINFHNNIWYSVLTTKYSIYHHLIPRLVSSEDRIKGPSHQTLNCRKILLLLVWTVVCHILNSGI